MSNTYTKGGNGLGSKNGYSENFTLEEVLKAYLSCRKNKRNTINQIKFEINLEENLYHLYKSLNNGSYYPGRSICFVVTYPKLREIFAADFKDRVVHHLLVSRIESFFEKRFIFDSYACRKDKGVHKAISKLNKFVKYNPKEYKFSLGQQIINKSWETMDMAISANLAENKDKYIEITNLLNSFDKLKTRIRMAHELKVINDKKYAYILKQIVSIEKDIINWLSWAKSTKPK